MQRLDAKIIKYYRQMVEKAYPGEVGNWPILNGHTLKFGKYRGWSIFFYENTGNPMVLRIPLEHLTSKTVGVEDIGSDVELARKKLIRYFRVTGKDMLLLLDGRATNLNQELNAAFEQHKSLLKIKAGPAPEVEQPKPIPVTPEKVIPVITKETIVIESIQPLKPVEFIETAKKEIAQVQEQKPEEQKEPAAKQESSAESHPQRNKVFIISGSSEKMKKALSNFLLSLGLQSVEWAEALSFTGNPDAEDAEVISKSLEICQAAIIILTNNKDTLSLPGDASDLTVLPRAELNALFAAGLAAGNNRHRTVVVGLGNTEPFRDLPGLHMTRLDNSIDKRKELMDRLKIAGCEVKTRGKAWHISGDFEFVLKPIFAGKQAVSQPADAEPAKNERIPKAQPDKTAVEEKPVRRQPRRPAAAKTESIPREPEKNRSFLESLPLLNILLPKKQPINEEEAADLRADLKSKIKPEAAIEETTEPTPIVNIPTPVEADAPPIDQPVTIEEHIAEQIETQAEVETDEIPSAAPVFDVEAEISQDINEEPVLDEKLTPLFEPITQPIEQPEQASFIETSEISSDLTEEQMPEMHEQETVVDTSEILSVQTETEAEETFTHGSMYEPTQSELRQLLFEREAPPPFQPEPELKHETIGAAPVIDEEQPYVQPADDVDTIDEAQPAEMDKAAKVDSFMDIIEGPEVEKTDIEETAGEREPSSAELECMDRLKELEDNLVELKKRGGRLRKRAIEDTEKQIEVERQRLNFLRRLADIEKS